MPDEVSTPASGLPIAARREEIIEAIRRHPVIVVAGETGSGKSTQIPRYCLDIGRGGDALIAHTQPRRIAARALATRIATEMSQTLGGTVGFRVRFDDQVSATSRLILMTDGLLLTEVARDPDLRRYDTLIIDEAHERSLNIDLLFGVAKRLLARRPELRVIVTSATLDVARTAEFFGQAPVIVVEGRGHPVEVRYRASDGERGNEEDPDLPTAVVDACREILTEPGSGDTLVFLPGEREIRDVSEAVSREFPDEFEVLPLFSRMPWEQQQKIFEPGRRRRVVLATNVAETSITVPRIRYVIDSGLARISRYNPGSRLQRLPIEPIPQASADQRKGRCGRIGPGVCIRLYSQEDFEQRPVFSEPEVLRTNLSALLLRLAADNLGSAEEFPFLDPPDRRALNDGYRTLQELEALDAEGKITGRGRAMARLPLDPRLGRALLESKRFKCAAELLAIVSRLSVPDPSIRIEGEAAADPDERFEDSRSEFLSMVRLWKAYRAARKRPRRELRLWCREKRLSLTRLSEWENVYLQVVERARELGIVEGNRPASFTAVHRALLAGFCTMIGQSDEAGTYLGTRGVRFTIFPGSPLKRRRPRWILAANIVETSRVFARTVAQIEPSWIEPAARHLIKREYFSADWDEAREEVIARERVSLLGLTLSAGRTVNYGPIDPEAARHLFAREALVHRRMARRPTWLLDNDAAVDAAQRIEERLRMRGLAGSAEALTAHYENLLPRQISSADALEAWTRRTVDDPPSESMRIPEQVLFAQAPDPALLRAFPEEVRIAGCRIAVRYRFDPDAADDGVTLEIPLLLLPHLTQEDIDAAVPGLQRPRIDAWLRSLPKTVRISLIPLADTARQFLDAPRSDAGAPTLAQWLILHKGIARDALHFAHSELPANLVPTLAIRSDSVEIGRGKDLATLRDASMPRIRTVLADTARSMFPIDWRSFVIERLPVEVPVTIDGGAVSVFAALAGEDQGIQVSFRWSAEDATRIHLIGVLRLARVVLAPQMRDLTKRISQDAPFLLAASPYARAAELTDAILQQTCRRALFPDGDPPRTRAEFDRALQSGRSALHSECDQVCAQLKTIMVEANAIRRLLEEASSRIEPGAIEEARAHLAELLTPARWRDVDPRQLRHFSRYLKAAATRWKRAASRPSEVATQSAEMRRWREEAAVITAAFSRQSRWSPELEEFGWLVEEYRSALSAQELKTAVPVSASRLQLRLSQLQAALRP